MDSFFDIKEFIITLLRRINLIFVITLLCALAWASTRFVPLTIDYITYKETPATGVTKPAVTDMPLYYTANRTLVIKPSVSVYDGTAFDNAPAISAAYKALLQDKKIFGTIAEQYFEEAKSDDAKLKEKMVAYNYRTRAVFNVEFTETDFYKSLSVDAALSNVVTISAKSGNPDLSDRMVGDIEKLLTAEVRNIYGDYDSVLTEGTVMEFLPDPTTGLIPKKASSENAQYVTGTRPSRSFIMVRSIKGAVWGGVAGFALSLLIVFFFHVIGIQIESEKDLEKYNKPIVVVTKGKKKRLLSFVDLWIARLQGRIAKPVGTQIGCRMLLERIHLMDQSQFKSNRVLLSGCCDEAVGNEFAAGLQKLARENGEELSVSFSPCITYHPETVSAGADADVIVLTEQAGRSNKSEIDREYKAFSEINRPVSLFLLVN